MLLSLKTTKYEIPVYSVLVASSIEQYYTTYTISTNERVFDFKITLCRGKDKVKLRVLNEEFKQPGFVYTCIEESVALMIDTSYSPYNGYCDLKTLLRHLGVPNHLKVNTPVIHWNIPRLRIIPLIQHLNNNTPAIADGIRFYINDAGELDALCFGTALQKKPVSIPVEQHPALKSNYEWLSQIPSIINITRYLPTDIEQYTLTLYKGLSEGNIRINDTTSTALDKWVTTLSNDFYYNYFNTIHYSVKVLSPAPLSIGSTVSFSTISAEPLVVTGTYYTIQSDDFSSLCINAVHNDPRYDLVPKNTLKKL